MSPLARVLGASGAIGFALGVAHVDLQWAVEHAQVLAGAVRYPAGDPIGAVQAGPWSLVSQVAAIGLRLGLSESQLCWLLSGLLGTVSCQAVAAIVFAISGRVLISLGAIFVVIVSRSADWGVAYPIALFGSAHTYGVLGLSLAALAIALAGAGGWRIAVLLATLLLSIHAAHGALLWLVFAIAWLVEAARDRQAARDRARSAILPLAAAGTIVVVSFIAHGMLLPSVPADGDPVPVVRAFLRFWDGHRQPVGWTTGGLRIVVGLAVVAVFGTRHLRQRDRGSLSFLLIGAFGASVLGVIGVALTHVPVDDQPLWLAAAMPGRFMNLALFLAAPVLLGLASALPGRAGIVNPVLLTVFLLASRRSLLWSALYGIPAGSSTEGLDQLSMLGLMAAGIVVHGILIGRAGRSPVPSRPVSAAFHALLTVVLAVAVIATAVLARREVLHRGQVLRDYRSDDVFAAAAGAGRIVTGGHAWLIQLRTRTPILIDASALDVLAYSPASAPRMVRILHDVYGIDLLNPPPDLKPDGRVPAAINQAAWERYTREDWHRLRREFGITHVVTDAGWQIDLPSLMMGRGLQVFAID